MVKPHYAFYTTGQVAMILAFVLPLAINVVVAFELRLSPIVFILAVFEREAAAPRALQCSWLIRSDRLPRLGSLSSDGSYPSCSLPSSSSRLPVADATCEPC